MFYLNDYNFLLSNFHYLLCCKDIENVFTCDEYFFGLLNGCLLFILGAFYFQHAILKPFMLRRVKKDVVSELTGKTEVTVHCKLSSRQQAFYQAIKNKISLSELFDSNRGHLNEKKILNLMNIVIQLRKVVNLFHYVRCISFQKLKFCYCGRRGSW